MIRVPGKDTSLLEIDREAERITNERAAAVGVAPRVAAMLDDPQAIVTVFVEGRGMTAEDLREPATRSAVARALRAIHEIPEPLPSRFDSFRLVETFAETAVARGATLPEAYGEALAQAAEIEAALAGPEHEPVPCHNDLLAANFIAGPERLWIVDWEYAGMGDRYFDLANFSVNNELADADEEALLADYFGEPPSAAQAGVAAADAVHVRLPRGDVGGRAGGRLRAGLRLQRLSPQALRPPERDGFGPAVCRLARGGA